MEKALYQQKVEVFWQSCIAVIEFWDLSIVWCPIEYWTMDEVWELSNLNYYVSQSLFMYTTIFPKLCMMQICQNGDCGHHHYLRCDDMDIQSLERT
jgi:hypothetical protein